MPINTNITLYAKYCESEKINKVNVYFDIPEYGQTITFNEENYKFNYINFNLINFKPNPIEYNEKIFTNKTHISLVNELYENFSHSFTFFHKHYT